MKTDKPTIAEQILTVYFRHNNCSDGFIKAEIERFVKCPTCAKAMEQYRTEGLREEIGKICDIISSSLKSVRLLHFKDDDENELQLLDYLSSGDTVMTGDEEIQNIVEQIYFDLDNYLKQKGLPV
jgi:hypothetical protein